MISPIQLYRPNTTPLNLTLKPTDKPMSGLSPKSIYTDENGREYFIKTSKPRSLSAIFNHDPTLERHLAEYKNLTGNDYSIDKSSEDNALDERGLFKPNKPQEQERLREIEQVLKGYAKHVSDVIRINSLLEILSARLCGRILGDLVITPCDSLYFSNNQPLIISPSVGTFVEFLAEHPQFVGQTIPEYWHTHTAPSATELIGSETQARFLGQIYAIGLFFNHYDLVNNINLSNSGYVRLEDGVLKLCIVDWGNALGAGFNGLTADESGFKNPQFREKGNRIGQINYLPEDSTGFQHVMPFDRVVYPLLPRQVVPDLFDLTAQDSPNLRNAQLEGFYDVCTRLVGLAPKIKTLVAEVVEQTFTEAMSPLDSQQMRAVIPHYIEAMSENEQDETLANTLLFRIRSLGQMQEELMAGKTIQQIAKGRLRKIANYQGFPSTFFQSPTLALKTEYPLQAIACNG